MIRRKHPFRSCAMIAIVAFAISTVSYAHTTLRAPPDLLDAVGFDQHLGAQAPLDDAFRDADGEVVHLRDLLGGKPALLVPGYFGCVNLCGIVRAGVARAVAQSGFVPGSQYNVVLVSIDPHETPADARTAQRNDALAHPKSDVAHWHYLTGDAMASAALMRSIGFRYRFDPRNHQYAHAAGIVLLSPQGRVTQYLFGVQFPPRALRLGLVAASHGRIGNVVDRLLLLCCDYDASTGRYSLVIHHVMQGLGIASALTLAGLVLILRRSELRRRGREGDAQP